MKFAMFARPVVTIYDLPETTKESDAGVVSTIGDEGLYGQVCQVRTEPGGVTADGITLPETMAEVVTFYGYHGYVFASELYFCGEKELRGYLSAELVLAGRATDVLTLPKVQGVRLAELERGAVLRRLPDPEAEAHTGWAKVGLVDGRSGYVRDVALEPVRFSMTAVFTQEAGRTFAGIDCSGLVSSAYMQCGVLIYRDAKLVEGWPMHKIPLEQAKRGDALYFPGHIALYLGEGRYIHSTGAARSGGVVLNSLDPADPLYREDLVKSLYAVGSLF